jgi:hypothetical protein
MLKLRRHFVQSLGLSGLCVALPGIAQGQTLPKPLVIYDDGLQNGWQNWSWAKVKLEVPIGGGKPIEVQGDPWSALALHHDAFSTAGFGKLSFFINGGVEGGQTLFIKAMIGGKAIDADFRIQLKAKAWAKVEVPLKDIAAADTQIDTVILQGGASSYPAYYVTRIQLE